MINLCDAVFKEANEQEQTDLLWSSLVKYQHDLWLRCINRRIKPTNLCKFIDQRVEAMSLGFFFGVLGVLILAHAAYSTVQYRGLLKIMEEEFSGPPFNVVIELLLGLLLCMWAALTVPGKFLSIHPDSDDNSFCRSIISINDLRISAPLNAGWFLYQAAWNT
ncbi:uncharacterized protein LOC123213003 isoform X2 [Mangifera indica]|uniref:uncharacterized protein LOC123213003 isoform X2 n=1 Tax=Mangifera indica TaxID=29780 RepID=UPI001CFA8CFB|nr:uncharacterized protein LOC123213003 isoform X2 [Mangifera indica]